MSVTLKRVGLLLDFVNPALNPGARVAVELDLASGKAFCCPAPGGDPGRGRERPLMS